MFTERTSVGLDVHARSVAAAGLDTVTGEVWERNLRPGSSDILAWLTSLAGPVAVTYEAGPTGFGLARDLAAAGYRCQVAAPSKIRRAPGDRVKTDSPGCVAAGPVVADGRPDRGHGAVGGAGSRPGSGPGSGRTAALI